MHKKEYTLKKPVEAPESQLPAHVHIEYLGNISRADAEEYAVGYLKNRATSTRLHYGIYPHNEGYILEVQESGHGRAYTPNILSRLKTRAQSTEVTSMRVELKTAKGSLFISCSALGLESMLVPQGVELKSDYVATSSNEMLQQVNYDQGDQLMRSTRRFFLGSMVIYLAAMSLSPNTPAITLAPTKAQDLPLAAWVSKENWPANKTPVAMKLNAETKKFELQALDISSAKPVETKSEQAK